MTGITKYRPTASMVVAVIALFAAFGGGAYAAQKAAKNSVVSKSIKNAQVKGVDVKDESLTGADINESTLQLPQGGGNGQGDGAGTGAAGGDLAGNYPNPTIKDGAVTLDKLADEAQPRVVAAGRVIDSNGNSPQLGNNSFGLAGVTGDANSGTTYVTVELSAIPGPLPKTVGTCTVQATPVTAAANGTLGEPTFITTATGAPNDATEIQVQTRDHTAGLVDRSYDVQVTCPQG